MAEDAEFNRLVDKVFNRIENDIDALQADIDVNISGNILYIEFLDQSEIIISRQISSHEIWIAAKSGGYRLSIGSAQEWRCTSSKEYLPTLLSRLITEQSGFEVKMLN
ncbi:MAG: iron donor protein CyaY [Candidatus Azotimanducaceae bacterium]|uniref:Iron-sulfur cluster assembly protein CyaY n=1 Tax=OM182 bacterium TaxID=2510334 RepID=A0A520S5U6_9GAMM|nr:iron donor protein CyaY [Gammaproteobacteria bacterium]OUV68410.1 MAG: iron donor protein CyaY [Gammaproteobacteria bacterium TMED133]RZO77769.1 MAG: iron donor protein CyaY [OM182 bacterium]